MYMDAIFVVIMFHPQLELSFMVLQHLYDYGSMQFI